MTVDGGCNREEWLVCGHPRAWPGNAHIKEHPRAPLANNPEAARRFLNKTLAVLKQCDPSFEPASGPIEQEYVMSSQY